MNNFKQAGDIVTLPAPYQRNSGQAALIGGIFGVAVATVANGADGQWKRTGVFELPKTSAQAWTAGAKIYWDNAAKECTTTASGNTLVGCATEAAVNPSSTGMVLLDGAAR